MSSLEAYRHRRSPSLCTLRHRTRSYPNSTQMKICDIYGPAAGVKGRSNCDTKEGRCRHISGLGWKASEGLRALMKSALLLLNRAAASGAVSQSRIWRSRSDLSCHQLKRTPSIVSESTG